MNDEGPQTLIEAVRYFSDRERCREYMRSIKWPSGNSSRFRSEQLSRRNAGTSNGRKNARNHSPVSALLKNDFWCLKYVITQPSYPQRGGGPSPLYPRAR